MKAKLLPCVIAAVLVLNLAACTKQEQGTAIGAGLGAAVGYGVSGGNVAGTLIGGGAGALIGHQVAR